MGDPPVWLPRPVGGVVGRAVRSAARAAGRRARSRRRPPRQRLLGHGRGRRPVGGDVDGADAARRIDDGNAVWLDRPRHHRCDWSVTAAWTSTSWPTRSTTAPGCSACRGRAATCGRWRPRLTAATRRPRWRSRCSSSGRPRRSQRRRRRSNGSTPSSSPAASARAPGVSGRPSRHVSPCSASPRSMAATIGADRDGVVAAGDGSSPAVLRIEAREDIVAARAAVDATRAR